ncbi:MAG TPA: 2,3-bisphosphoglycerate-independent phosphoglycerate mutase [Polyangiales bacterium]|nr:2,3-bisphosphoglycerate-independent phosphoglycerate mutase [Polyangiales bacterium]
MTDWTLKKHPRFAGVPGPVLVCVMDGVGCGDHDDGDAVFLARTPTLDFLSQQPAVTRLTAHGTAVGMPSDADMGNSEVGHNALGAGRTFDQGAKLVDHAIKSGALYEGETWRALVKRVIANGTTLHLIGLLSDGNVHSHIDHLFAMLRRADREGVKRARVHVLLDGRDVSETSALTYVDATERLLAEIDAKPDRDYRIASGGGRQTTTMDRYNADWRIVERGWKAHVLGEARGFKSTHEAIETYRSEHPGIIDQDLGPFTIVDERGQPVGRIQAGDSVILFNFRGDRAIELCQAFEKDEFSEFARGTKPDVLFAGMMEYDGDLHVPQHFLVSPPEIDRTLGEYLVHNRISQLATSETQKFGHVTYFWNGNRSGMFDPKYEKYVEVPSDRVPFEQRPWMKAAEITDVLLSELRAGQLRTGRFNYANGDMVGHTGKLDAAVIAVEAVDLCLARLLPAIAKLQGALIVTADHGNCDEMFERDKKSHSFSLDKAGKRKNKTSHTLNRVPFYVYAPSLAQLRIDDSIARPTLANVAATTLQLMGYSAPDGFEPGLLAV